MAKANKVRKGYTRTTSLAKGKKGQSREYRSGAVSTARSRAGQGVTGTTKRAARVAKKSR